MIKKTLGDLDKVQQDSLAGARVFDLLMHYRI